MLRYLLPLVLLMMVGCSSKVDTDYDPSFSTEPLKTFFVIHKSQDGVETLDEKRLNQAINRQMQAKGYESTAMNTADFHITFQRAVEEDVPSNFSFGFGFGTYSRGVGTSVSTTQNVTDDEEKFVINMIDPATKKTFWRAEVTKKRRDFKSPQARSDYIDKTVAAMLKEFPVRPVTKH
ncbi:DUF4136 domain-containing protein [Sulfurimonas sp. HSL3-7]|uniref:DUF4136 domain-containing protein n=1 Tax=Sulfonitrofixus jiaomeiensis TaxID=3131938 RepID=UPI0031FA2E06